MILRQNNDQEKQKVLCIASQGMILSWNKYQVETINIMYSVSGYDTYEEQLPG